MTYAIIREQAQNSLILLAPDSQKSRGFFATPFEWANCSRGDSRD
jgi:hypothetical protein